ncbi:MAG: ABC transporter permease subunit, partial [Pirellulales bacterium]
LVAGVCLLSVPAGVVLAVAVTRTDVVGRRMIASALVALLFMPLAVYTGAWQAGLAGLGHVAGGAVAAWMQQGLLPAVLIHAAAATPWVAVIVALGLRLVRPEIEEAALLDAPAWRVLMRVTVPRVLPAIAAATAWVALTTAGEMTVTDVFVVRSYAEEVYTLITLGERPSEVAGQIGPTWALLAGAVAVGLIICGARVPVDLPSPGRRSPVFCLGPARLSVSLLIAALMAILVALPLGALLYQAGVQARVTPEGAVRFWSGDTLIKMVAGCPTRYAAEFGWSAAIAGSAATAALVVSAGLVWLGRWGGWRRIPLLVAIGAGLAIPGPLVGLAIIAVFNAPGSARLAELYERTLLAPTLAQFVKVLPVAALILWFALGSIPRNVLEAAALDGAGPWTRFWQIAVPMRRGAFAGAWLAAFALAVGEIAATKVVLPPGVQTITAELFGLLHYGADDQVAAICLTLAAGMGIPSAVVAGMTRRR